MEEEVSRMKTFLKEFNNDQIQSPTSDEITHARVGNYDLDPEDVTGQVIDWVLNYLDNRKCPYSLALSIAKEAAQQVSASFSAVSQSENDGVEKSFNSSMLYAEAIGKLSAICNSFSNQANLELSCSPKYTTSVFAIKNKRRKMEDRHVIHHDLNALLDLKDAPHQSYYAVFDGHSGIDAACYASAQLHINIAKHPDFLTDTSKAIIEGYQITDLKFLNKCNRWNIKSGCTAVSALIRDNTIYLSWLGDSQAVLVKDGAPVTITNPHKPDREDEKERIESLGGHISHVGTWRVNGLLAVTRAIGDPDQKRFISSEPELSVLNLDGTEDFLILACDGLWDEMSPEDVISVLYRYLEDSSPDEPVDAVAAKLVHQAKLQGSEDNITTIVVFLRDIKDIKENSAKLMKSSVQGHDFMSMNGSMKMLNMEHCDDAPFSKPTVLELNAASSKKLKNAANVMSSAGFGSASYSYQYVENTTDGAYQNLESSAVETAQNVFRSQNVTASCFAPEATALSELPTPPIDDMLASQQFENFYSTDLYKEFSNSMQASQIVDVNSVDTDKASNETFQSPILKSGLQPVTSVADDGNKSLLDNVTVSSDPNSKNFPDEAVGIASTVVSTAIETAVKCLSSSETQEPVPAQSPKKLNPYAKPFVMKSFFNPEESESKTCSFASSEVCDVSLASTEEHNTELDNLLTTNIATELSKTSGITQPDISCVDVKQFTGDVIDLCIAGNTTVNFTPHQVNQLAVDAVASEHSGLESKLGTEQDSFIASESNFTEKLINLAEGNIIDDSVKTGVTTSSVSNVTGTNDALNPGVSLEHLTSKVSEISFTENISEITQCETVCVGNKENISDSLIENFETLNVTSDLADKNVTVLDINALPIFDVSKDSKLSPLSCEDSASDSKTPKQELIDVIMQSSSPSQSDLCELNQNVDSFQISTDLTAGNTAFICENESKHEINEKCIVDTVIKDDHCEAAPLAVSLTDHPLSSVNAQSDLATSMDIQSKSPTREPETESSMLADSKELALPSENQNSNLDVVVGLTSQNIVSNNYSEEESKYIAVEQNIVDTFEKNVIETSQFIKSVPSEVALPSENQNSNLDVVVGLKSENIVSKNSEEESKYIAVAENIVDTFEKNVIETSQLIKSMASEAVNLIDIKSELIPAEAEVPSVEDSHVETVAVDLKLLPAGIPEAEGVTEDIDSDSEKDGGWSYMKGNIVSGSKTKPNDKTSKTLKSNEMKSTTGSKGKRDVSKPNLDVKSKMKNASVDKTKSTFADKTKNISVDKAKTVVSDKSKTVASVDKIKTVTPDRLKNVSSTDKAKTIASVDKTKKAALEKKPEIKTKIMKSSTLTSATKVTVDKTSRVTGVSSVKREITETTRAASSTIAKSPRPTTLMRGNVPANKPASTTAATSKVATRPKVSTTITENKSAVKSTTSTLSKVQNTVQTKSTTTSTRIASTRPVSTIPSKTSTVTKSSVQKSVASESKPKQPTSAAVSTLRKPLFTTVKKSEVKEVKDSVNKQISAKKNLTASKVDSSSTLVNRKAASVNTKSANTRMASSATKPEISKKDVPKAVGLKSTPKNVGSKVSQDTTKGKEKSVESIQYKTEETKNSLNIESDQKNITEIVQVTEEKFILETSDKEIVTKKVCEISAEEIKVEGSLTNPVSPVEDKAPTAECAAENL